MSLFVAKYLCVNRRGSQVLAFFCSRHFRGHEKGGKNMIIGHSEDTVSALASHYIPATDQANELDPATRENSLASIQGIRVPSSAVFGTKVLMDSSKPDGLYYTVSTEFPCHTIPRQGVEAFEVRQSAYLASHTEGAPITPTTHHNRSFFQTILNQPQTSLDPSSNETSSDS